MKTPRILTTSIALILATHAFAVTDTWDGGGADSNISTNNNWLDNTAPLSDVVNTDLIFAGSVRLTPSLSAAFSTHSITFNNTAGAFNFTGQPFTLGTGGIVNNDADPQIFNSTVLIATGVATSFNAASGGLTFASTVGFSSPSSAVTLDGPAAFAVGNFSSVGTATKNGAGAMSYSPTFAQALTLIVNAGTVNTVADGSTDTFNSSASIAMNGTSAFNINESLTLDGAAMSTAAGATFSLAAGKTLTVQNGGDINIGGGFFDLPNAATLSVGGVGSTFNQNGSVATSTLSFNGGMAVSVLGGGALTSVPRMFLGNAAGGTTVSVFGSGATMTVGLTDPSDSLVGSAVGTTTLTFSSLSAGNFGGLQIGASVLAANGTLLVQSGADVAATKLVIANVVGASSGTLTVSGAGSTFSVGGAGTVVIGAPSTSTALLNVNDGGLFDSGTGAVTIAATGIVNLNGGTFTANGALTKNGALNFTAGTLNLLGTNSLTIGTSGLLGANLTLLSDRTLTVANTTIIEAARTLTLNGGTFRTGTLLNNGTLDFQKGTLGITGAGGLNIGSGILGANVVLGLGANLEVTNTTTITAGALLRVDGGSFTGNAISNSGTIDHRDGALNFTGALSNLAGARLFVGGLSSASGPILNNGAITLQNGIGFLGGAGTITNSGLITGEGTIAKPVTNSTTGQLRAELGKTLTFTGTIGANPGTFSLAGGTLEFTTAITNLSNGFIAGHGELRTAGITNQGTIAISGGNADLFGDVTNSAGAKIVTSGGAVTTFFDDVVHNGTEIRTSAGGSSVFFGAVSGAGPYTGTGTVYFEGDLRPGNSPALITFGGDVVYGSLLTSTMEVGGTARGTQYDALNVAGKLTFGGTLNVPLISGFQPAAENVFNLYDFGTHAGTFSTVNLPALAPGLAWSQANLYTAGEIQVALDPVFISRTWDGGGANNNWITDNNWTLDVQPLNNATADLIFTGNVRLAPSVDSAWNVRSITFNNAAGAFTITGPQGVTIGSGGIVNNDTQTQTITAAITLSANETFNAAAGDLAITSVALAGQTLAITGANDLTLATASGTGTINKNNTGRLDITGALGTGGVTVNANTGATNIGASETLAALNIANGAVVTIGAIPPAPAPEFGDGGEFLGASTQAVPEPGVGTLLASGLALLARRSRAKVVRDFSRQNRATAKRLDD